MPATYTWDVYGTLDGFASYTSQGDWGGYWGKEGPEFLAHRKAMLEQDQRLVLGANTFRDFVKLLGPTPVSELDPVNARMKTMPTTVMSTTIEEPVDWPDVTLIREDAVRHIADLKRASDIPLRSHGSLSLNKALLAAGLVDQLQISIFPVISGITGQEPVFAGALDFDLDLVDSTTFDGRIQVLIYRPSLHDSSFPQAI